MSNPYHQHPHSYSSSGWNSNTGHQNLYQQRDQHHSIPFSTYSEPEKSSFKRSRDDSSPADHSWQQSFKRLKVMEDDSVLQHTSSNSAMGGGLPSVSVDETSLVDESATLTPPHQQVGYYPQHSVFFPPEQANDYQNQGYQQYLQTSQNSETSLYAQKSQSPGQGSSEDGAVDYQPMNSLLGSLHRTRRRQHYGTGQDASSVTSLRENGPSVLQQQQPAHSHPRCHQQELQTHIYGTYMRPAKKKNLSLRVSSNLH